MIPSWRGPPPPTNMPQWQGMPPQGGPPFYWQNQGPMMGQQIPPNFNLTPQNNSNKEVPNASNVEDQKLMSLQMQAQQWQQQKQMQEWLNQSNPQMTNTNISVALTPEQLKTKNDKTQELEAIKKEEEEFDKQYREWEKQFDQWKEQNKNHPNKEQFKQYEEQWSQWKAQMNGKKAEILGKKDAVEKVLAQLNAQTNVTPSGLSNNVVGNSDSNPAQFMYSGQPGAPLPPQGMGMNNFAGPGPVGMMPPNQLRNPMMGQSNYQQAQPPYNDNSNNSMMMGQGQQRPPMMSEGGHNPNEYSSNYGNNGPYNNYQSRANIDVGNSSEFKSQNYDSNEDRYDNNNSYDNPNPSYNASDRGMGYGSGYNAQGVGAPPFNNNNMGGMMRPPIPTPSLSVSPNKTFNPFPGNNNNPSINKAPTFQPTGQFTYGASLSTMNSSSGSSIGGERKKGTRWGQPIQESASNDNNDHNYNDYNNNGTRGPEESYDNGKDSFRDLPDNEPAFQASYSGNYPPSMGGPRPTGQIQDGGDGLGGGGLGGGTPSNFLPPRPPFNPAAMMMMMRMRGAAGPPRFPPRGGGGPFFNRPNFSGAGPPFGRHPFTHPRAPGGPDPPRSRSRSPTSRSQGKNLNTAGYGRDNYRGGGRGGSGKMSMPPYKVGARAPFRPPQPQRFNSNSSFQGGRPRHMQQNFGYQGPSPGMGDQKTNKER